MRKGLGKGAVGSLGVWGAVFVLAVAAGGCTDKKKGAGSGEGQQLAGGKVSDLRLTPSGEHALYLLDGEKPRLEGVPEQMLVGELWAVPTAGGGAQKLGNGVTNRPGGWVVSADSRWALFLAGYNPVAQTGTLMAYDLSGDLGEAVELGRDVSYMVPSPDSKGAAFVSEGVLQVGPLPKGPFRPVSGEVHTAGYTPDGQHLLFRRKLQAAGGFFVAPLGGDQNAPVQPVKLGEQVGDFSPSPDSGRVAFTQRSATARGTWELFLAAAPEWKTQKVAVGVGQFGFSPDSKWLARTEGGTPDELGDLHVGPAAGGAGRKLAPKVKEFEFSPQSDAVAWLERYDIPSSAGILGFAELPAGEPKRIGNRVPNFAWSPDGKTLAFISRFIKPVYTVDLMLYRRGTDEEAKKVHQDVFAYNFEPKGRYVLYRSNCTRNARACDLFQLDPQKVEEGGTRILEGIFSFRSSQDGERLLVTHARMDSKLYDVAVYNPQTRQRKLVAQFIQLPAQFADKAGERVIFMGARANAAGVYAAEGMP